ncbi:MAG: hypothetical protein ACRC1K_17090 [Planctomycetia bacterium]
MKTKKKSVGGGKRRVGLAPGAVVEAAGASAAYERATPHRLGNLHERMKLVMAALDDVRPLLEGTAAGPEFVDAVHDLEMEVQFQTAAQPPLANSPELAPKEARPCS